MSRQPRKFLPSIPCHIAQHGHNGGICFYGDEDYRFFLECLDEARNKYGVKIHAYVLMQNHFHLMMTPSDGIGISRLMQSVGRRYVQYFNDCYRRSGTLWEGRYKASLIQPDDDYLLTCYKYIERNPVRPGLVDCPGKYAWTSYHHNAMGQENDLLSEHIAYSRLGDEPCTRRARYREFLTTPLAKEQMHKIRRAFNSSVPFGDPQFKSRIINTVPDTDNVLENQEQ